MRVGAETAHRLRLAGDALAAYVVEALGLDQGERDVAVEQLVVGEVNALLAALAEEALHHVAATGKWGRFGLYRWGHPTVGDRGSV